jgi:hypothetical protein
LPATLALRTDLVLRCLDRADDADIRRCAQAVFGHFGVAANLYILVKVREAEAEGNGTAVGIWMKIAAVVANFEGMEASTAIH